MDIEQSSSLDERLKLYIVNLYIDQNTRYAEVMTCQQNVLKDVVRIFNEHLSELIKIASMNKKFAEDIDYDFREYQKFIRANKNNTRLLKKYAVMFWDEISTSLRNNGLIVIKG